MMSPVITGPTIPETLQSRSGHRPRFLTNPVLRSLHPPSASQAPPAADWRCQFIGTPPYRVESCRTRHLRRPLAQSGQGHAEPRLYASVPCPAQRYSRFSPHSVLDLIHTRAAPTGHVCQVTAEFASLVPCSGLVTSRKVRCASASSSTQAKMLVSLSYDPIGRLAWRGCTGRSGPPQPPRSA
jgi:hypothetical protein